MPAALFFCAADQGSETHTADWSIPPGLTIWQDFCPISDAIYPCRCNSAPAPPGGSALEGLDSEDLLISFLSELVFYIEQDGLSFDQFDIQVTGHQMSANMAGGKIASVDKAIKAVTWHNLRIERTPRGLEVEIVFDV
jgi:hypothetical protein